MESVAASDEQQVGTFSKVGELEQVTIRHAPSNQEVNDSLETCFFLLGIVVIDTNISVRCYCDELEEEPNGTIFPFQGLFSLLLSTWHNE